MASSTLNFSNHDTEKIAVQQVPLPTSTPTHLSQEIDFSGINEKKLLRKIDIALIPWVISLLYLLSFLDRSSIGNARLYHLQSDLHLSDNQFNMGLTIFFFSYSMFEVPSNVFLKRLRPSIWLPTLMLLWGIVMTVQGLVHDYGGLLGARWMLGTFEAGLFPGVNFYLSWYKRSEFGIRAAFFFSAATVSGAFGGLLAAAISNMNGVGGKPGWAWIFILEGLLTIVAGVMSYFIIQDFPDTAKFLTEPERAFVIYRLQSDDQYSAAGERLKWKRIFSSLQDWKTWIGSERRVIIWVTHLIFVNHIVLWTVCVYMGANGPLYAFSLFLPTIISQLGFAATPANLLTVPVYAWACMLTCGVGFFADRWGHRGYFNLVFLAIGMVGYVILINSRNAGLSYFAVFMAASGIYPVIPNTIAWFSNNVEGSYKRSVTLGMIISFGNLNGAVTSNVYRSKDKPWYTLGHGIVLLYIGLGWIASLTTIYFLRKENARRERGERDEIIRNDGEDKTLEGDLEVYDSIEHVKQEKGDSWSGYRYTL